MKPKPHPSVDLSRPLEQLHEAKLELLRAAHKLTSAQWGRNTLGGWGADQTPHAYTHQLKRLAKTAVELGEDREDVIALIESHRGH